MKKYPEYKDSGIDLLGYIPDHWEINKFNRVCFYQEGPGLRNWQFTEFGTKVICVTNIVPPNVDFSAYSKFISEEEYKSNYRHFTVNKGDLLLASSGASWGKLAEYSSDEKVILNTSTIRLNALNDSILSKNFIKWILQSEYISKQLEILLTGSCQPNFGPSHLNRLICLFPPKSEEQTKITTYLDHKTRQIDDLIAKKQKLIKLLQEERSALINQAVTRGLDPTVPMKDSGIEWVGEIPEHWKILPIKKILKEKKYAIKTGPFGSQLKSSDMLAEGIKVYNQRTIYDNDYTSGEFYVSEDKFQDLKEFQVYPEDILISSRGTIGKCSIVPEKIEKGILHPCLIRIQLDQNIILNEYFWWYVNHSSYFLESVNFFSNATTIEVIYSDTLKNIRIPVPEVTLQHEIINFLNTKVGEIEVIIEKGESQLSFLNEYKTSLINEAVTGKIDVRDYQISHA